MKAVKREIKILKTDGTEETVVADVFGGALAMHRIPDKLPRGGRKVSAYIITHVRTGRKIALLLGREFTRKAIYRLFMRFNWDFDNYEDLTKETREEIRYMLHDLYCEERSQ